jgi:hypothetical protein
MVWFFFSEDTKYFSAVTNRGANRGGLHTHFSIVFNFELMLPVAPKKPASPPDFACPVRDNMSVKKDLLRGIAFGMPVRQLADIFALLRRIKSCQKLVCTLPYTRTAFLVRAYQHFVPNGT